MANHHKASQAEFDIASLDIHEPLAKSALLAQQWAKAYCTNCGTYHGAWQLLRLLGVLSSIRSDDDFLVGQLDAAIGSGASKILVSGAADYALLARIVAVANRHDTRLEITVVDCCETPLKLNHWYAAQAGIEVELVHGDILNYQNPGFFDLICTHSFLCLFNEDGRRKLVNIWWDCLQPSGAVLTAQRARPDETSIMHGFSTSQVDELGQRAYRLAEEQYKQLGIDPQQARHLAVDYAANRSTYVVSNSDHLRQLFSQQGFVLEHFAPPGKQQLEKDIPSTPTKSRYFRWRILARKPGGLK